MSKSNTVRDDGAAFRRAISHSRRVTAIKWILPIIGLAAAAVSIAGLVVFQNAPDISVDLPDSTISDGRLVMANPKLDGFTADRKPYRVVANRAIQDLAGDKPIELEVLRADVELDNGNSARLTSKVGSFDSATSVLILPEQGILTTTDGTRAVFGRADIDIQSGAVNASNNVRITNDKSEITAYSMQVLDGGDRVVFENAVRVIFEPSGAQPTTSEN